MAETLETGEILAPVRPPRPAPTIALPPYLAPPAPRFNGILRSAAAALDERRLFLLMPFAMIAGLIVSIELSSAPHPAALAVGAGIIGLVLAVSRRFLAWFRLAALAAAFWAGLCLLPLNGALWGTSMLARPVFGTYTATVDEIIAETPEEKRVVLSAITPTGDSRPVPMRRARVLIKAGPDLSPGDVVSGPFRFAPVPGPIYPGGFDTQFHGYFDGIGAYGNSTRPPMIVSSGNTAAPAHVIDAIRRGIADRIDAVLPQPSAGIARAIVNGDQSAVTEEARATMATAGIAHVLSVSGLHLTIVAGGVFWVLRLLFAVSEGIAPRVSVKRVAAVFGMASALLYFAVAGSAANVAAFRSTLMILLVFGAVLFGRRALTMRNVAIAGVIVIATDPASLFRPSFQLSFAAVVALVGAYENLRDSSGRDAGPMVHALGYLKGIGVTSVVAGLATLLFSIHHFQQTSPLVGFVMMPAAVIAVLLMPFGVEGPMLRVMGWSVDRMLDLAGIVAGWSTHLREAPLLTPLALVIGFGALAWFAFFKDRWRLLGPALAVPLVVLLSVDHPPDVLIADTTRALLVRGSAGLEQVDGKGQSFGLNVWRETYADSIASPAAVNCDTVACIGQSSAGFSYAIVTDPAGFADECGRADLVVARGRAPDWCGSRAVIDSDHLAAHGVQWPRWNPGSKTFEVRPAIGNLDRPWRIAR